MITSEQVRRLTRPQVARLLTAFGQDAQVVRSGTQYGVDAYAQPLRSEEETANTRVILTPVKRDANEENGDGASLPDPLFDAYLPHDAPLDAAGWTLRVGTVTYTPAQPPEDVGLTGLRVLWRARVRLA